MPGFRLNSSAELDDKYFCRLCKFVLREPIQTSCGHLYCQSCCFRSTTEMHCVVDGTVIREDESFPDKCIEQEILHQRVCCTHQDEGCMWRGMICHLEQHRDTECPAYPVTCEKCNKDGILRGKLKDHQNPLLGDCEAVQEPCPFSQIGCPKAVILNQKEKKQHLEKANTQHVVLALQFAMKTSKELVAILTHDQRIMFRSPQLSTNCESLIQDIQNQLQEVSGRITTLERELASCTVSEAASSEQRVPNGASLSSNECTRRVTNIENGTADHEVLLVDNNCIMEEARRYTGNIRRQLDTNLESTRRSDRRIESIEQTLVLRNVTLADLEEYVKQQEFSSYDGQLLWRISDYTRKRNEAVTGQQVSFYSPCFFSSRYGYKMCARIYLNGDGMGKGTHISIFFVIMRGEYDALLRWPFGQKVTFMLLDQGNVEHVIDAFRPDPNSSSFQRPRRETNIASGCPMFCSLAELNNHAYVRDDAMFLKIIVDTSDL